MAFANPAGFGQIKPALLLANVEPSKHAEVVAALNERDEVVYLSTMLGEFDLCIQVYTEDEAELLKLTHSVRELPGVQSVKVMLEIDVHKLHWRLLRTPAPVED
ncbi:Lrp/AsnC ligand binding domain-containing protein [Paenarthrobacter sp. NPDC058040]|uniref:Lrp/AsnC ligand binding domain-containing protein n=1 Tax=unclassified Paenarthrobacter TaxID=2634190 RepID=UPI0036DB10C3